MIDDALSGRMWPTGHEFEHWTAEDLTWRFADNGQGAVVVVPGAAYAGQAEMVNRFLADLPWTLVCVTSDEERRFPLDELDHPNMAVWVQTPTRTDDAHAYLPVGYPPHYRGHLPATTVKTHPVTFAGQVNHTRRREAVAALRAIPGSRVEVSAGFTQGLAYREYAELLAESVAVVCPSGPKTVDSFRVVEALEAGAVPIVDSHTPSGDASWLWARVFAGPVPFPTVNQWADIVDVMEAGLPTSAAVSSWWQAWKRTWCQRIGHTVSRLSETPTDPEPVTVLIPTSPIAAHPDTAIIEETIASVRFHHPTAEILVMCDGVRPEQTHYRSGYNEYLDRLTWLCARDGRALAIIHDEHLHQAEMTRRVLALVNTPLVLFVEHDTPLVVDEPFDWPALTAAAISGEVDLVRFHFEAHVHPEHEHLMLDQDPRDVRGAPLLRTVQWSQRPHLANTGFYRRILREDFPAGHVGMIEDVMHSVVHTAWRTYGLAGWDRYRLAMYAPPGNIKRSLNLDGRGTDAKWVDS
jgi:hypothetical protein